MSRILIAEDSVSIRLLLRRRLEMAEHEVIEARDGVEALDILEARQGHDGPDVVLLDATMPRMDGAAALREIKGNAPDLPVLVVSAIYELDDSHGWGLADGHVTKPIDFDELLARIDLLTGGRPRPGSPSP
jgi:two-component system response regulator ResD